mmetsp:Transcript_119149/g.254157  ORF Transcript_119149/g.254157 Transcript_119149/m.254157 type:complete len:169 (-) Transcript_119149:436-942(-)
MKPDWDKLIVEYKGHASVLVADVDCTAAGKDLCEKVGVKGFPTIKYGDPNDLEDYDGGRSFKDLQKFAKENLGPRCGPANLDLCDEARKTDIAEFMKMDAEELAAKIAVQEEAIKKVDSEQEQTLKSLNEKYQLMMGTAETKKKKVKDSGLNLAKAVSAHRKTAKREL